MRVENPCVAAAALTPAAAQRGSRVYCCMVTVLARQVHGAARARFFRRNEAMATGAARQHSPHIAGGRYAAKAGGGLWAWTHDSGSKREFFQAGEAGLTI